MRQSPKIKQINFEIKTLKKLKGFVFYIEHKIWKTQINETIRIELEIERLERKKIYVKRHEELEKQKAEDPNFQPNNHHNGPSLEEIKQVPIRSILEMYGIKIERNNFFKVRNEKTASAQFNDDKNLFYDHGNTDYAGSNIDLIMILENISTGKAIKFIIDRFF